MAKLTTKKNFANRSIILPVVGLAKFDKDNFLEVPDESVEALVRDTVGSIDLFDPSNSKTQEIRKELDPHYELKEFINSATISQLSTLIHASGKPVVNFLNLTDDAIKKELLKCVDVIAKSEQVKIMIAPVKPEETGSLEEANKIAKDTKEVNNNVKSESGEAKSDNSELEEMIESADRESLISLLKTAEITEDISNLSDRQVKNMLRKQVGLQVKRGRY